MKLSQHFPQKCVIPAVIDWLSTISLLRKTCGEMLYQTVVVWHCTVGYVLERRIFGMSAKLTDASGNVRELILIAIKKFISADEIFSQDCTAVYVWLDNEINQHLCYIN